VASYDEPSLSAPALGWKSLASLGREPWASSSDRWANAARSRGRVCWRRQVTGEAVNERFGG
jgi:hypothetical protein